MTWIYHILFFTVFSILWKETVQSQKVLDCKCGRRKDHNYSIFGGKVSKPDSFPWMATLYYKSLKISFCGGALINDRYVITSGICASKGNFQRHLSVVLGLNDKSKKDGLEVEVSYVLLPEGFRNNGAGDPNDIALLKLNEVIQFTEKIHPICLPKNPVRTYAGEIAQIAGSGKSDNEFNEDSKPLKEFTQKVLFDGSCKIHSKIGNLIQESMLCAYRRRSDICQGGSGTPLTFENPSGKNELIGIYSWGLKCGHPNAPDVYTRVTSYLNWIYENTKDALYCKN